ncbi:multi-sensor Hybrid histidine Kinase [Burkholderia lata]|uniref:Multi-sensor Hybrid histidine Kinase n=2 Tax=Burkholderia lata (strain ATCC 17760 / DSM 23089 / LMG 22485 / NCIMB 9086 / R18194 / 383) TaxID=482957 RepID=A0A6P2SMD6_BURL3|nr:multi-sensor Hybrid histidine Kinase [Burkholderia lata]
MQPILVVDDSAGYRLLLRSTLGKLGFEIVEAEDGREALQLLRERREIAVVVCDWDMPELDGPGLCRAVRGEALGRYVYLILLTARDGTDALIDGMEAGADDFLTKPVDINELRVRLRAGLRVIELEAALEERNRHLDNAYRQMRGDLQAAAAVQTSMLPSPGLRIDGLACEWLFVPSAYLSGDMLNVKAVDDVHAMFYAIDVAGHGVQAAMLSVIVNRLLARGAEAGDAAAQLAPASVVAEMNRQFLEEAVDSPYFTMVYGALDTRTGEGRLTQAGHTHPLLVTVQGEVTRLGNGGFPVGLLGGCEYDSVPFALGPGDRLFLYSDGVTECAAPDGEQFGDERLRACLSAHVTMPLRDTLNALKSELCGWRGTEQDAFEDDVSVLALQRVPV